MIPLTVPVKVGPSIGAFKFSCAVVSVETGLAKSVVFSALAKPTIALVIPLTVPVKVGPSIGALAARAFVIVVA